MADDRSRAQLALLEEYRALRAEMLWALNSRVWGVASYAIISGAILAVAAKNEGPPRLLGPVLLAGPYAMYAVYAERIRVRIHTYIECILEPVEPGLKWERSMVKWRRHVRPDSGVSKMVDRLRYFLSLLGVYDVVAGLAFYALASGDAPIWHVIAGAFGVGVLLYGHLYLYQVLNSQDSYRQLWRKVSKDSGQLA